MSGDFPSKCGIRKGVTQEPITSEDHNNLNATYVDDLDGFTTFSTTLRLAILTGLRLNYLLLIE